MSYLKKRGKYLGLNVLIFAAYNLYYILLMRDSHVFYLFYLDLLLFVVILLFLFRDYYLFSKQEKKKKELLQRETVVFGEFPNLENIEVAEHDVRVLNSELNEKFQQNCDLQDYVARWCHEVKIPLSAALLMNEKTHDVQERQSMKGQLEKIKLQINSMLSGCRLQSAIFDLQIQRTSLEECVRASIHNNHFFLIQKKMIPDVKVDKKIVYTDKEWLTYILDQLISNAVKYTKEKGHGEEPSLRIWTEEQEQTTVLFVEDNGEGICREDLRRVFEKGYTGGNQHNGKYKSTGMGLYLVEKVARRLGHEVTVESELGRYTRFKIVFSTNDYYKL